MTVFVPFLGDFLSIEKPLLTTAMDGNVFVPFLGDFLSIMTYLEDIFNEGVEFSSPFLGTFFQWGQIEI